MSFLQQQFNIINCRFDVNDINMNEQKNEIKEMKSSFKDKLNEQNSKFDEIRNEIKQQNFNFSKQVNEFNTRCDGIKEQIYLLYTSISL